MNTCRTVNFFILSLLPLTAISETLIDSGKSGDWEWEIYAEKTVAGTNLTDGEPGSLDLRCEKAKGCSYVITFDDRDFDAQCQHGSEMNSLMDQKDSEPEFWPIYTLVQVCNISSNGFTFLPGTKDKFENNNFLAMADDSIPFIGNAKQSSTWLRVDHHAGIAHASTIGMTKALDEILEPTQEMFEGDAFFSTVGIALFGKAKK